MLFIFGKRSVKKESKKSARKIKDEKILGSKGEIGNYSTRVSYVPFPFPVKQEHKRKKETDIEEGNIILHYICFFFLYRRSLVFDDFFFYLLVLLEIS